MGKNLIIKFLEEEYWDVDGKQPKKIREVLIVPLAFRKTVYGVNLYFPADGYRHTWEDFERLKELVSAATGYSVWVNTLCSDFNHGIITIIHNVAHREYSDERVVNLLKKLTNKFFPDLKL